jgi:hypothetical protein
MRRFEILWQASASTTTIKKQIMEAKKRDPVKSLFIPYVANLNCTVMGNSKLTYC